MKWPVSDVSCSAGHLVTSILHHQKTRTPTRVGRANHTRRRSLVAFDSRATHARTLQPTALASVPFGFVLVSGASPSLGLFSWWLLPAAKSPVAVAARDFYLISVDISICE